MAERGYIDSITVYEHNKMKWRTTSLKTTRLLALFLALCMIFAFAAACKTDAPPAPVDDPAPVAPPDTTTPDPAPPDTTTPDPGPVAAPYGRDAFAPPAMVTSLPRNETLYYNGFQWGMSNGWNAFSNNMNNPLAITQDAGGARIAVFEPPYMYNPLDNKMYPLLADGGVDGYTWNDSMTELTYKIKEAAYWSDGTKVTAHDAAFTYFAGIEYGASAGIGFAAFIDRVEARDDETVVIHAVTTADGKPANPLMMITFLGQNYILQKAWLEALVARNGGDPDGMANDPGDDVVWSGPYAPFIRDESMTAVVRDDGYWGQHPDMWGQLPVPKYLAHAIFEDNPAGDAAFFAGEVDVSQNFVANIHLQWQQNGLPISTYMSEPPYGLCVNMPTAFFNMNIPVLADNPEIRQAIAWAVDYDMINANAMTGQSPTFTQVPRSLMAPPAGEQAMYNKAAVSHLQWAGRDYDSANALLDDAGFAIGADGIRRTPDGQRLSFKALCPAGWTDWEASMEIVAAAGANIGIEITTEFPEWDIYQLVVTASYHDEYDIFMMWTDSTNPTSPWGRARGLLSSEFVGIDGNWSGNWGHYVNARADQLIAAIPIESDQGKIVDMYTELVEIYLTDVPSFSLMYRPDKFHSVNESVWTGFTEAGDGRNVPPINAICGYAIADLYNLRLVNP